MDSIMLFRMCAALEGYLYFFTTGGGAFARMDMATGDVQLIGNASKHIFGKDDASGWMMTIDRSIYALTNDGRYLVEYQADSGQMSETKIDCDYYKWGNIAGWFEKDKKIYIYPRGQREEVIFNRDNRNVSRTEFATNFPFMPFRICKIENNVYLFGETGNCAVKRTLDTGKEESVILGERIEDVRHIVPRDGVMYILTAARRIYVWDYRINHIKLLCDAVIDDKAYSMAVLEDRIIIPPFHSDEIQIVDRESGKIFFEKNKPNDFAYYPRAVWGKYIDYCENDDFFFFAANTTNYVLAISKKNGAISWIHPSISSEKLMQYMFEQGIDCFQEAYYSLPDYISCIQNHSCLQQGACKEAGHEIWMRVV